MDPLHPHWLRSRFGDVCIHPHGGHVSEWIPNGQPPVLWLSPTSRFATGEAIRGGVPVIFPWFGDDPERRGRPAHGFARRRAWRLLAATDTGAVCELVDDEATRAAWPHAFAARLRVEVGDALTLALTIENRDRQAFDCEVALHSYFAVGDVQQARVEGLARTRYIDKVDGMCRKQQDDAAIAFVGETDRVHTGAPAVCELVDPVLARRIRVERTGGGSTIVWNPGAAKAARMADVGPEAWRHFACVESGAVGDDRWTLAPGAAATLTTRLAVRPA